MNKPTISVIMPVYNGEKYLKEAIDSILNQTFSNFEFIILNDGSTDKTEEIILSYEDSRIVYVKNEKNIGITKTLNKGIALAKGEYIARMDADDISLPERFEKQIEFMEKNPDVCVCGSWIESFGYRKGIWKTLENNDNLKVILLTGSAFAHPSVMIRKSVFNKEGVKYDETYRDAQDYKLWVDLSKNCDFYNLQEILLKYRTH